eukprot:4592291-Prymnesium_polylepis.1
MQVPRGGRIYRVAGRAGAACVHVERLVLCSVGQRWWARVTRACGSCALELGDARCGAECCAIGPCYAVKKLFLV